MAAPDRGTNPNTGFLYMFGGGALVALFISLAFVTRMIGPASIPIWGVTMLAAIMIGVGPIGKAIGKRIAGETPDAIPEAPEEVYTELDDLRARMLEMEERQDFAERLLAERTPVDGEGGGSA